MLDENNLCLLGDFATSIDYVLTDEGDTAYLYHVRLQDVVAEIDVEAERRLRSAFSA